MLIVTALSTYPPASKSTFTARAISGATAFEEPGPKCLKHFGPGHISRADGRLQVQLTAQGRYPVYAESEKKFIYKVVNAQLTFTEGPDGAVSGLTLR